MIRQFRVSVSERYPVKADKWKDAGTYEARNSRDIQAFLIENPQIWARYIRIEFLSHYGNEYYCPLSLVRVHGTRMLESWKETEAISEDEGEEGEEQYIPEAVADVVKVEERLKAAAEELAKTAEDVTIDAAKAQGLASMKETTPWKRWDFYSFNQSDSDLDKADANLRDVCPLTESPLANSYVDKNGTPSVGNTIQATLVAPSSAAASPDIISTPTVPAIPNVDPVILSNFTIKPSIALSTNTVISTNQPISSSTSTSKSHSTNTTTKYQSMTTSLKNKTTSTTSSASSLPTIQESFFKAVSRRLNFLETNSTLSLQYISEQSKILREAFTKVEKKQLQKTNAFLDTLNSTVLSELRNFRQQYDEIWQSTVISLESQRDESRREILAISTRLNILADEVVFQKRMSIIQSILLLLCLGLVIFSRVSSNGTIDFQFPIRRGLESPVEPESSEFATMRGARRWLEAEQRRRSGENGSRDDGPPTPISTYSHSNSNEEDITLTPPAAQNFMSPRRPRHKNSLISMREDAAYRSLPPSPNSFPETEMQDTSPRRESPLKTPKKRKIFNRPTPPPEDVPPRSSTSLRRDVEEWPLSYVSPPREPERGYPSPSPDPSGPEMSPFSAVIVESGTLSRGRNRRESSLRDSASIADDETWDDKDRSVANRPERESNGTARKPLPALPSEF
jgi:hypothetical protein